MNDNLDLIFREDGILKKMKDDYVPRPSQIEAADRIRTTLSGKEHIILEGPCGFGKTFGYGIPLADYLYEAGENSKAVIVTNGISLQEQLYNKDLPLMQEIFSHIYPDKLNFAILKGKQNFLCPHKLAEAVADTYDMNTEASPELQKIMNWAFETHTGDFSELDFVPSYETLDQVACIKQGECLGRKCDKYNECYYQRCKAKCEQANIIVTNYHILFSDLQTGGKLLPKYDVLVCDEAHEMAEIYRDFVATKLSVNTIKGIRNEISEIKNKFSFATQYIEERIDTNDLIRETEIFLEAVKREHFKFKYVDIKLIESPEMIPTSTDLKVKLNTIELELMSALDIFRSDVEDSGGFDDDEGGDDYQLFFGKVSSVIDKLSKARNLIEMAINDHANPLAVYWFDKDSNENIALNSKPVKVGQKLAENFFAKEDLSVVFASATLSVNNSFDYIKTELGLDLVGKPINEFIGDSPFNLTEQQLWYLPPDAVDGNNPEFDNVMFKQVKDIVMACHGGVLGLFTSVKNMNKVYDYLKWEVPSDVRLLKQGMKPRNQLIDDFKDDVNSVLLATKSFFTGIDVPGESLRCVIIDKLPFASPNDPVMQKLRKEDNSFFKYFIPAMVITLKQAVGRGVRSINDKCVVCILDGRMSSARTYKSKINNSFNYPKTGTRSTEDVARFVGNASYYDDYWKDDEPF